MMQRINSTRAPKYSKISQHFLAALIFSLTVFPATAGWAQSAVLSSSASTDGHEAKFVDVNGARTRYYDVGSGEVVLLILAPGPAGRSSANTWTPMLSDLRRGFH